MLDLALGIAGLIVGVIGVVIAILSWLWAMRSDRARSAAEGKKAMLKEASVNFLLGIKGGISEERLLKQINDQIARYDQIGK